MTTPRPLVAAWSAVGPTSLADPLREHPELRKATEPMLLAYRAVAAVLSALPDGARAAAVAMGLVVGVDHGELQVTREFLETLDARGVARPLLFQSSLHNATLGFLSLRFGVRGPGLTTSTRFLAGEDALDLGADLVRAGDCAACLVVGVEASDPVMDPVVRAIHEAAGAAVAPTAGAGAVLLVSDAFAAAHALAPRWRLGPITVSRSPGPDRPLPGEPHYGADGVERLVRLGLAAGATAVTSIKPDGAGAAIVLEAVAP